jgi:SAM-dependent methyltransferase
MKVPSNLQRDGVYYLPAPLLLAYREELTRRSLLARAREGTSRKDIHGGSAQDEADDHFALRFLNSASRPQHLLLGHKFDEVQAFIFSTLASGQIAVLDLACGTGAGTLAILSIIAELRRAGVLPSLPLNVDVVGADFSTTAREVFEGMLIRLSDELKRTGIDVALDTLHWDATMSEATSGVCDKWLASDANEYLVIVNNFSGHGYEIEDQLNIAWQHISDRLASRVGGGAASWLRMESEANKAKKFLGRIRDYFTKYLPRHFSTTVTIEPSKYEWWDDMTSQRVTSSLQALYQRRH